MKFFIKANTWILALILSLGPLFLGGCGIFNPHVRNAEGYYEAHYDCCGPTALENAFDLFLKKEGVVFVKRPFDRKEISKLIQDRGVKSKELLAYFNRDAICITWPSEMEYVAKHYGFKLITIDELDKLDREKDVAIVLVHSKITNYHWLVFPIDDVEDFFGKKTVVDKIYLLKRNVPKSSAN